MSTITSEFTKGQLQQIIETDHVQCGDASALARIALASLDAEAVAWDYEWASCITCEGPQGFKRVIEHEYPPEWAIEEGRARNIVPLYAAPPAQVSERESVQMFGIGSVFKPQKVSVDEVDCDNCAHYQPNVCHGEGCPAAMLQGADGNSPVIQDGWVMVPVEPTPEMQSAAAGAIRFDTTPINKLWTGNAVYKAMLAAAPQQEV